MAESEQSPAVRFRIRSHLRTLLRKGLRVLRSPLTPVLFLLAVSAAVVAAWFSGPYYLYFLDELLPFNPIAEIQMFSGAWNPLFNGGDPTPYSLTLLPTFYYYAALYSIGIPIWLSEFLFYFGCLFLGMTGTYRAAVVVLAKSNELLWIPVLAALVYAFNPVTMIVGFPNGAPLGLLLFAALPWVYVFYRIGIDKAVSTDRFPYWEAVGATLALVIVFGSNVPSNIGAFAVIVPLPLAALFRKPRSGSSPVWPKIARFAFTVPALAVLAGGWWEVPLINYVLHPDASAIGNFFQTSLNLSTWQSGTAPATTLAVLTMNGFPNWGWQSVNSLYTGSSPIIFLAIPFVLVCFSGVLFTTQRPIRREWTLHCVVLLIIVAILTGVNSPIASSWKLLLGNPVLGQVLRFPWFALWTPFLLYFSILFAVSFHSIWNYLTSLQDRPPMLDVQKGFGDTSRSADVTRARRRVLLWRDSYRGIYSNAGKSLLVVSAVAVIVVYPLPLWTGSYLPNTPASERVEIPPYVQQAASFLSANSDGHEAMIFPPGECLDLSNWSQGYIGQSIDGLLAGTPTIYSSCRNAGGVQEAIQLAYGLATTNLVDSNYSQLLSMLNVKYIVLRWDAGGPFGTTFPTPEPGLIDQFLRHQPGIAFIRNFGNYSIFENLNSPATVFASLNSVSDSSLWSYKNITSMYYNRSILTVGPASLSTIFPRQTSNGLSYSENLTNYTGGPLVAANSVPLEVNTSVYSTLEINLSVNSGTAVTLMASSRDGFPSGYSFWSGDPIPLFSSTGTNSSLGGGWPNYYAPSVPTTLTIDLRNLAYTDSLYPPGRPISPLNYVFLVMWRLENGSPEYYVTEEDWHPSVTLESMEVGGSSLALNPLNFGLNSNASLNPSVPQVNLSSTYFDTLNSTTSQYSPYNSTVEWTYSANQGYIATYNHSLGSYAVLLNTRPLGINTTQFPFLGLDFEVPSNMSVEVMASSLPILNGTSLWDQQLLPLGANNGPAFQLNASWFNWYTSTMGSSIVFDLQSLLTSDKFYPTGSVLNPLNYLAIVIYPTADGSPVFGPIPPNVTPSIRVLSISAYRLITTVSPLTGFDHYAPFNASVSLISTFVNPDKNQSKILPELTLLQASSTDYVVHGILQSAGGFYVTLTQNFDPGWSLSVNGILVPSSDHFEGDLYANSWYLPAGTVALNSTFVLTISYSPQKQVEIGEDVSAVGVALIGVMMCAAWLTTMRKRRVSSPPNVAA